MYTTFLNFTRSWIALIPAYSNSAWDLTLQDFLVDSWLGNSIKNKCTKHNVVFLLSISAEDVQSNTGSNLRRILLDTGIKIIPGSTAHSELNEVNIYEIPAGKAWRYPFLCSLLKIRDEECAVEPGIILIPVSNKILLRLEPVLDCTSSAEMESRNTTLCFVHLFLIELPNHESTKKSCKVRSQAELE
jgi:hypothetical protein